MNIPHDYGAWLTLYQKQLSHVLGRKYDHTLYIITPCFPTRAKPHHPTLTKTLHSIAYQMVNTKLRLNNLKKLKEQKSQESIVESPPKRGHPYIIESERNQRVEFQETWCDHRAKVTIKKAHVNTKKNV